MLITGLPIKEFEKIEDGSHPYLQYKVDINSKEYLFRFCIKLKKNFIFNLDLLNQSKHIEAIPSMSWYMQGFV